MRALSRLGKKNKRGVSVVIGYVLLIVMSISISVIVYNWLRFYAEDTEVETCPEGVSLAISEATCTLGGELKLTIKNTGRFDVDGFKVRTNERDDAGFGIDLVDGDGEAIGVGDELPDKAYLSTSTPIDLSKIKLIEIQPVKEDISCNQITRQKITCT